MRSALKYIVSAVLIAITALIISCSDPAHQSKVVFISAAIDYGPEGEINYLANPPEDQRVLSAEIRALAEGSGEIYEEYLFLEKNGERTFNGARKNWNHDDILSVIASLDTVAEDLIIFHYSGHGDDDGSLVTDMDISFRLSPERLLDQLENTDGKKCLFLDSCYSGTFIDGGKLADGEVFFGGNLISESFVHALLPSLLMTFSAGHTERSDIWVFSAATENQSSFDSWDGGLPEQENFGAFTYYLASALGYDMENDRAAIPGRMTTITFYDIYQKVKENMDGSLWKEATPQVTLSPVDLVLFRF